MKAIIIICLFLGAIVANANSVNLDCAPTQPCQYVGKGQKYCISKFTIAGLPNGHGQEIIDFRSSNIGYELKLVPQKHSVAIKAAVGKVYFNSSDGDQWGELTSAIGGRYVGQITFDQDFQFEVSCADKAIGFEKVTR